MPWAHPPGSSQGIHLLLGSPHSEKPKAMAPQQAFSLYTVLPNPDTTHQLGGIFIIRDVACLYSWHPVFIQFTENKTSKLIQGQIHP